MKRHWFKELFVLLFGSIQAGFQLVRGMLNISRMQSPVITIFGGMRAEPKGKYTKQAYALARQFAKNGYSILTGGGPGIMEAANCGVANALGPKKAKKYTLGIGVKGVDVDFINPCTSVLYVNNFFVRKWLLIHYSAAIVVFPGGIGTMDELFEQLNLIKHKLIAQVPVILIGTDYWQPLVDWFKTRALEEGFIKPEYLDFFMVTDDLDEAFKRITSLR